MIKYFIVIIILNTFSCFSYSQSICSTILQLDSLIELTSNSDSKYFRVIDSRTIINLTRVNTKDTWRAFFSQKNLESNYEGILIISQLDLEVEPRINYCIRDTINNKFIFRYKEVNRRKRIKKKKINITYDENQVFENYIDLVKSGSSEIYSTGYKYQIVIYFQVCKNELIGMESYFGF